MIKANFSTYGTYVTDSVYQWDINRELEVRGINLLTAPEIHFYNANMGNRAIVRQATLENGIAKVMIPNSILQEALLIRANVVVYEGDTRKTIETIEIPVVAKARPLDYSLTDSDEEIYSFNALENYINNTFDKINNIVLPSNQYRKDNIEDVKVLATAQYLTFVGNVNADLVASAFGKNNENNIKLVGMALAMYSDYNGENLSFNALQKCNSLRDIHNSPDAITELFKSSAITALLRANTYTKPFIDLWTLNNALPEEYRRDSFADIAQNGNIMRYMYDNYTTFEALNILSSSAFINEATPYAIDSGTITYAKTSPTVFYNKKCLILNMTFDKNLGGTNLSATDKINVGYRPNGSDHIGSITMGSLTSDSTVSPPTYSGIFASNITVICGGAKSTATGSARALIIPCE